MTKASYTRLLTIDVTSLEPDAAVQTLIECIFDQFTDDPALAVVTLDQSLHDGAQIRMSPEGKRMHANLRERLQEVLDRGKRDGIFDAQITTDNLEFMTTIIVSGCVSSRGMFTRFLGQSAAAQESPAFWRDYAVRFILRAIRL